MNQFKKELNLELQSISLSKERKQLIATKAKAKLHNHKKRVNWQYRFVLAAFTMLALGFSYLLWQEGEPAGKSRGAAPIEVATSTDWSSLVDTDFFKVLFLIALFIFLRIMLKIRLQKGGKGLPVCVECSEEWSYKKALKQSMKNREMTCPYCGKEQYRTKKSSMRAGMLGLFIPFTIITPQLFDHILLGLVVSICCTAFIMISLSPYLIDLQEEDPFNDPLW
jgi:CXXC-20-CXXC protein